MHEKQQVPMKSLWLDLYMLHSNSIFVNLTIIFLQVAILQAVLL